MRVAHPRTGEVLASTRSTSQFTMTTAAMVEDVPTMSVTFTFDGRPVRILTTPLATSQDQNSVKLITLSLCRSSDNAVQASSIRQSIASNTEIQQHSVDTGYFTAWPSDGVALVPGTQYTVKLRLNSGASSKAKTNGDTQPYSLQAITG